MFERYMSKLFLSPKTSIGGYVFDVYLNIGHSLTSTVTSHPTQFGASISDHKYEEPDVLTFQIGMSDSSQDLVVGQFFKRGYSPKLYSPTMNEDGSLNKESLSDKFKRKKENLINWLSDSRSVNAFNKLKELKLNGELLTCITRLGTYTNMVIESIDADDTFETKNGLMASVTLREVMLVELQRVQVNSTAQITQTTNMGSKNAFNFDLTGNNELKSMDYIEFVEGKK